MSPVTPPQPPGRPPGRSGCPRTRKPAPDGRAPGAPGTCVARGIRVAPGTRTPARPALRRDVGLLLPRLDAPVLPAGDARFRVAGRLRGAPPGRRAERHVPAPSDA